MLSAAQRFSLFMLVLIFLEHAIQYSMVITYFNYIISSSGAEGVASPSPSPSLSPASAAIGSLTVTFAVGTAVAQNFCCESINTRDRFFHSKSLIRVVL